MLDEEELDKIKTKIIDDMETKINELTVDWLYHDEEDPNEAPTSEDEMDMEAPSDTSNPDAEDDSDEMRLKKILGK